MRRIIDRPSNIFWIYIAIILIFSFIYWAAPYSSFDKDLGFLKSIYLSVITITTLGYGDITPKDNLGMVATSIESIIGILIIGIYLNSIWKHFSGRLEKEQANQLKLSLHESNRNNLVSYYSYLGLIFLDYKKVNIELTTPWEYRGKIKDFSYEFKFSALQHFYHRSLLMKYGFEKSTIEIYFDTEKTIISELKYMLANFGMEDFPNLKKNIIEFLKIEHAANFKDSLIQYAKKDSYTIQMSQQLTDMIKKFEDLPPKEYHQANLLTPVIVLYQTIPIKMKLISLIENELLLMSKKNNN